MFSFFQYSLESAICLAVLLLPYWIWFRKTTFHQWNRFYLLGAVLFSLSAPLLNVEIETSIPTEMPNLVEDLSLFEKAPQVIEPVPEGTGLSSEEVTTYIPPNNEKAVISEKETHWGLSEISTAIYFLGFLTFTSLFLFRFARLFWLIRNAKKYRRDGSILVHLSGKQVFSFFNHIFFDQNRYTENELATLLRHERVHIQQKHSWDVLALEVLQVVFWFDPLYSFYKKLLQQEHEYFVDATTSKEIGQPQYAQLLLSLATTKQPVLGHAFAYIPVKHRIFKLFQKPSTTMEKSRFFIALPIVLSLFLVFSCSFDELEGIDGNTAFSGQAVKSVQAFFVNEQAVVKNGQLFLEVDFDEKGAIIKKRNNSHGMSIKNLTNYLHHFISTRFAASPFEAYSNYIEGLPKNFYPKNVQNLIVTDPIFKDVEMLLHYRNMHKVIEMDMTLSTNEADYNSIKIDYEGDKIKLYNLEGERETGKSSISMNVTYEHDLPTYWKKTREYIPFSTEEIPPVYNKKMSREELKEHLRKQLDNTPSLGGHGFEIEYNSENLLSKLTLFYVNRFGESGDVNERRNSEMHLFYNEAKQLQEMEIYNPEGTYLRKYRFHYNEAGFCTKKELINREGSVEFSVRFEYDFFD